MKKIHEYSKAKLFLKLHKNENNNNKYKLKKILESVNLMFVNGIFFCTIIGSMWYINQYRFFNMKIADTLFFGLALLLWFLGMIYYESYNQINKKKGKKNE